MQDDLSRVFNSGGTLRDEVYEWIKTAILRGDFLPDERLMEIHLADRLGVSRTPVREALQRLEKEHLVVFSKGCGARVAAMSGKDALDALDVRVLLEIMAARLTAQNITTEQIAELKKINEDIDSSFVKNNVTAISSADNLFHRKISEFSGNFVLSDIMRKLEGHVLRYRTEYVKNTEINQEIIEEHDMLIKAFEARDEEKAIEVIRKHILHQREYITKIVS